MGVTQERVLIIYFRTSTWVNVVTPVPLRQRVARERGYHIHEAIWEASQRENSICADQFTVTAAFRSKRER